MAHVEQPPTNAHTCVDEHHKRLGPFRDCPRYSAIPIDIWEEIFVHCLPLPENPKSLSADYTSFTPYVAPLLLCQVCRDWRRLAISLPNLWSFLRVIVSLGEPHPPIRVIVQWLKRSGTSPLVLSLFQTNEAEGNRVATGDVLDIFSQYVHRWQHIRLDLASSLCCNRLDSYRRKAPLLEQFHMRFQRLDAITERDFLGIFEEVPRLSAISVPSIASLSRWVVPNMKTPWNQLTHVSIDFEMSVGKVVLILNECRILKKCKFGVESTPDAHPRSTIIHTTLQSLELTIGPQELSDFLQITTFPALNNISIYGRGGPAELLAWPQEVLNVFLERSEIRLRYLGLHNTCIRSAHFIDLLQNPSMQTLKELVVDDDTDWIFAPCLSFSAIEMLTFNEQSPQGLLPALRCFRIRGLGCLWSVGSNALVDMAESRWRRYENSAAVRLRILQVQLSLSESPADYRRLKQLQKEGLNLEIDPSF